MRVMETCPVLRIFDEGRARAFYLDWLRFEVEFAHRQEPGMPLYLGIVRDGVRLHLSEHHGDGTPGSTVFLRVEGLDAFHAEIMGRSYGYMKPGIESLPWGRQLTLTDPFMNRLRLCEG